MNVIFCLFSARKEAVLMDWIFGSGFTFGGPLRVVCGWIFLCFHHIQNDINDFQFGFGSCYESTYKHQRDEQHQWDNISHSHSLFLCSQYLSLGSHQHSHTLRGDWVVLAAFKLRLGSSWNSFLLISFPVEAFSKANCSVVLYLADFSLFLQPSSSLTLD